MIIKDKVKKLPDSAGVYLFKDKKGKILYIGKAKNIRKRVSSYFRNKPALASPKITVLLKHIADIDIVNTPTEEEALILESALISENQPKYNTLAKDDKSYPYLKITNEKFPRLIITRDKKADKAVYYGPFTQVTLLKSAVRILQKIFPMRTCHPLKNKLCLEYYIGQCSLIPCIEKNCTAEYGQLVADLKLFLSGRKRELFESLTMRMAGHAENLQYEKAARIRNSINMLNRFPHAPSINYKKEMTDLARILGMKTKPERIEAFDISNISGTLAVASQVCFKSGRPLKRDYRKFKIKTVDGIDDFAMMHEAVQRRYAGSLSAKLPKPDLIVIDGGRGQLSSAYRALRKTKCKDVMIIGLAKKNEDIYLVRKANPIRLSKNADALHLVQRIRDEAHRFALRYHRTRRRERDLSSILDQIPGIGRIKKRNLLEAFGSVAMLRAAGTFELARVKGISARDAERIRNFFKENRTI